MAGAFKTKTTTRGRKTNKRPAKVISEKFASLMSSGIKKSETKTRKISKKRLDLINSEEFRQKVEKKAYEIFENRGYANGNDMGDWLEAERIVKEEIS